MARLATGAIDSPMLGSILNRVRAQRRPTRSAIPILLFALDLTLRMDRGEIDIDGLERIVQQLTAEAFAVRADRLKNYLGQTAIAANDRALRDLIEKKAREGGFEEFRTALARSVFGVVFTAHPTFSISLDLARILAELATGTTVDGGAIDQAGRDERMETAARVEHRPPDQLSLEVEHAWVTEALNHAHDAVESAHRTALRVAREHWPEQWAKLEPRLVTLASWVGYDQDGRTDITWTRTIAARLADKLAMIERHLKKVEVLERSANSDFLATLQPLRSMLALGSATVANQIELIAAAERDQMATAAFGRAMVSGRSDALVESAPIAALLDAAMRAAPDDERREAIAVMQASLRTHGLALAHIHVRLNASQLHNAARRLVGLETEPTIRRIGGHTLRPSTTCSGASARWQSASNR